MQGVFELIKRLLAEGKTKISSHGYDELAADGLFVRDIVAGTVVGILLEVYPEYPKGSCVLILGFTPAGEPFHAVWGIPKGQEEPAVLVTAYKPDPSRWSSDFRRRK